MFSFILFCSVLPGQVSTLETINSFPGEWCCANDGYLYGINRANRTGVLRKREQGQSVETRGDVRSIDPSFIIENRIYSTSVPGLIFVLAKNNLDHHFLLKSRDGGMTFTISFIFGEGNGPGGTNAGNVRLLRGLLELTRDLPGGGGRGALYIGEYNISRFRTPGGINDRLRIMKSTDYGSTWTKVVEWNTNGTNQVGHIHAMKQDPYTGEIYVCTGDVDSKSGIIRWDGVSPWRDNATLPELATMRGFRVLAGAQRYRACDVLFDRNYFYTFTDTQLPNDPDGSECGIWRGTKDFSSFSRVDNQIYDYDPMHVGWFGEKIGDTFIFTTARESTVSHTWRELNTDVYVSNDGVRWHRTGKLNWVDNGDQTSSRYAANVFSYNNRIYIDCLQGAGHNSTIQCELGRSWRTGEDPVILHPVYFVGNWNSEGNDSNSGMNADSPKKSVGSILMNNNISAGARIRVSEGEFQENPVNAMWSGAALQGRGGVVVEGQGMDNTTVVWSPGNSRSGIYIERSRTRNYPDAPLVIKNIGFTMNCIPGSSQSSYILDIADSFVRTLNCRFEEKGGNGSPLVNLANTGAKYVSANSIYVAGSSGTEHAKILRTGATGTGSSFTNCLFLHTGTGFILDHRNTDLSLKNCTFHGSGHAGIIIGSAADRLPFIKNCIFSSGDTAIIDLSGRNESSVDYNYYSGKIINVTDGGHSISGSDPLFLDASNGIFSLRSFSECAMAGISLEDVQYDISGKERKDPPCIGAFEVAALYTIPGSLTLSDPDQSVDFRIISTGEWSVLHHENWMHLSSTSGKGSGVLTVSALRHNNSAEPRAGSIIFSGKDVSQYMLRVIQLSNPDTSQLNSEFDKLKFYPNPVSGMMHIEFGDDRIRSFTIMNSAGAVILRNPVESLNQDVSFQDYGSGLYILEFASVEGRVHRVKVIRE